MASSVYLIESESIEDGRSATYILKRIETRKLGKFQSELKILVKSAHQFARTGAGC